MGAKTAFTSKDFITAFGITNREQAYWLERGYIVADIKPDKPRVFSIRQALYAGLIRYFQNQGFPLERAARISRLSLSCTMAFISHQKDRYSPDAVTLVIEGGMFGAIIGNAVASSGDIFPLTWEFIIAKFPTEKEVEVRNSLKGRVESKCFYSIGNIVARLLSELDADASKILESPKDGGCIIRRTEDPDTLTVEFEDDTAFLPEE